MCLYRCSRTPHCSPHRFLELQHTRRMYMNYLLSLGKMQHYPSMSDPRSLLKYIRYHTGSPISHDLQYNLNFIPPIWSFMLIKTDKLDCYNLLYLASLDYYFCCTTGIWVPNIWLHVPARIAQLININSTRKDSQAAFPKCKESAKCTTLSQKHIFQGGTGGRNASAQSFHSLLKSLRNA